MDVYVGLLKKVQRLQKMGIHFMPYAAAALLAAAVMMLCSAVPASAAAKLTVENKKLAVMETYKIEIKNKDPKAVYTYTSSDSKVASVSAKGVVTAKKAGTAEIHVRQYADQKATGAGTLTVKVKKAYLSDQEEMSIMEILTGQPGYYRQAYDAGKPEVLRIQPYVAYRNQKAHYWCSSSDEAKLAVAEDGAVIDTHGTGMVQLFIHETYKGKTRTLGAVNVNIENPYMEHTGTVIKLAVGEIYDIDRYIYRAARYMVQLTETPQPDTESLHTVSEDIRCKGDDVITFEETNAARFGRIKAVGPGSRYLQIFLYDYTQQKYTTHIGTLKVNVIDLPEASGIQMDFIRNPDGYQRNAYNLGEPVYSTSDGLLLTAHNIKNIPFYVEPYRYTGGYEVFSSDESVVTAAAFKYDTADMLVSEAGCLVLDSHHPGTAVVTLRAEGAETSFPVTVLPESFYTYSQYNMKESFWELGYTMRKEDITYTSSAPAVATLKDVWIENSEISEVPYTYADFNVVTHGSSGPVTLKILYRDEVIYSLTIHVEASEQ